MAGHARQLLDCGVTTARDLGDRAGLTIALRDAIAAGEIPGPRILAATAPLTPPGGHCWFLGGEVDGPEQIREQVRRNAAAGADVIKVMGGPDADQPVFRHPDPAGCGNARGDGRRRGGRRAER